MEQFVTERLRAFCERPRMWGSNEAVELQAILLMECEVRATDPELMEAEPRLVIDTYGSLVPEPLHETVDEDRFGDALHAVCQRVRAKLRESSYDPALVMKSRDITTVPVRVRDKLILWDDEDLREMADDAVRRLGDDPDAVYHKFEVCQRMLVGHVYHVSREAEPIPGEVIEVAERCLGLFKLYTKKGADDSDTEFVDITHTVINRIAFVLHHERKAKLAAEAKLDD